MKYDPVPTSITQRDERIIAAQSRVTMWEARYNIAKKRLDYYEAESGTEDTIERRGFIRKVNEAQDCLEDAKYLLRRARNGL